MSAVHRRGPIVQSLLRVLLNSTVPYYDIAVGDLIGADSSGYAVRAQDTTWDTDLATTQAAFAAKWVGVSADRSRANTTDTRDLNINVYSDGVFEVELLTAATLVVGDYLAPAKNASSDNLVQKLVKTTVKASALFVVVEADGTSQTKYMARLVNSRLAYAK